MLQVPALTRDRSRRTVVGVARTADLDTAVTKL